MIRAAHHSLPQQQQQEEAQPQNQQQQQQEVLQRMVRRSATTVLVCDVCRFADGGVLGFSVAKKLEEHMQHVHQRQVKVIDLADNCKRIDSNNNDVKLKTPWMSYYLSFYCGTYTFSAQIIIPREIATGRFHCPVCKSGFEDEGNALQLHVTNCCRRQRDHDHPNLAVEEQQQQQQQGNAFSISFDSSPPPFYSPQWSRLTYCPS